MFSFSPAAAETEVLHDILGTLERLIVTRFFCQHAEVVPV
jgi:hypothetical protein